MQGDLRDDIEELELTPGLMSKLLDRETPLPLGQRFVPSRGLLMLVCVLQPSHPTGPACPLLVAAYLSHMSVTHTSTLFCQMRRRMVRIAR